MLEDNRTAQKRDLWGWVLKKLINIYLINVGNERVSGCQIWCKMVDSLSDKQIMEIKVEMYF